MRAQSLASSMWHSLVRLFFRLLYGPLAWTYDAVAWSVSIGRWKDWVLQTLPYLEGPLVLELGHGPGHLQTAMAQQSLTPIGLDLSPQMGRLAHRRLAREGLPTRLVRARSQALPFPDGSFPDIVATFPTAYIVDPCTLRELGRVLTGEGRAVVLASMRLTGKGILSRLLEWLYRVTGQRDPGISQPLDALSGSGLSFQAEWVTVERGEILLLTGGHRSQ